MFSKLQQKWQVGGWRLLLILVTFDTGGSLNGLDGKKVMTLSGIESSWLYIILYITVVTVFWPLMVLVVSIPLGQFHFFRKYIYKIGNKMFGIKAAENNP